MIGKKIVNDSKKVISFSEIGSSSIIGYYDFDRNNICLVHIDNKCDGDYIALKPDLTLAYNFSNEMIFKTLRDRVEWLLCNKYEVILFETFEEREQWMREE